MEMIDVLKKLESIAESKPELVADAVANVKATNPKEVPKKKIIKMNLMNLLKQSIITSNLIVFLKIYQYLK